MMSTGNFGPSLIKRKKCTSRNPVLRPGSPVTVGPFLSRHFYIFFFLVVLHFAAIFSYTKKTRFGRDFAFVPLEHQFRHFCKVNIINAKFSIKKTDLHVKAVLRSHHSSVYIQQLGRDARTKPFFHLSFIYTSSGAKKIVYSTLKPSRFAHRPT